MNWEENIANYVNLIIAIIAICVVASVVGVIVALSHRKRINTSIRNLADVNGEITPQEFFEIKNTRTKSQGRPSIANQYDCEGVYVLFNKSKNMYFVGQGVRVLTRINNHFTGRGNGDVYADYKYGDNFTIKIIPLERSGFNTLNELERNTISTYNAYGKGYNKTRGNRG